MTETKTNNYGKIIKVLKNASNVAIFMHINPDCDCIGSAIALSTFLQNDGKKTCFFSPDTVSTDMISAKYSFLPNFNRFNVAQDTNFDLAVAVDTGDAGRVGDIAFRKFIKIRKSLVIDHHEIHEDFGGITLRESDAASTTQILYKLMKEYDEKLIDKEIAALLYAGLVTDSGGFTFENCSPETYSIAAKLVSYGINHADICTRLLKAVTPQVYVLRNRILSKTEFFEKGRVGLIVFREQDFAETKTTDADTDGIVNYVRDVEGVDLAISIAEVGDKKFKVSFRSTDKVNSAACAKCFGGGGHVRAAGCRLFGYFEDVRDKILTAVKEMVNNA